MYKQRVGVAASVTSYYTLAARNNASGRLPTDGSPTLILDFVPVADPVYGYTLSTNYLFQNYTTTQPDPIAPSAFINIEVWK